MRHRNGNDALLSVDKKEEEDNGYSYIQDRVPRSRSCDGVPTLYSDWIINNYL